MKRWLYLAAMGAAGALLLRAYVVEGIYIATPSMEPALDVGARHFAEKITFRFREPRRGDIIVFESPVHKGRDLVKRVIAVPGERVGISDKMVVIDGKPLDEPYARHTREREKLEGDNIPEMTVPENAYFVLGDNRDESDDSSVWKSETGGERIYFIPRESVKSRLIIFF